MWIQEFKTALILEQNERIDTLLEIMPRFSSLEEMEEAAFLLLQAKELIETKKLETSQTMNQLKNTLNFLKSSSEENGSTLNLKL